ncbi:MAG TPA: ADOP family duplicated permease [Thermoanaerobaculia bacterium]|jgi:predicted permease|nr:ADOP family duplicated permease [Thermoanaerobaculia bacterium]
MVDFEGMWHDLRHGVRRLRQNPLVTATVILTLAVGVGAVTTAFTIIRGVLSPLDYPQADKLVRIHATLASLESSPNPRLAAMWNQVPVSYQDTVDWRKGSRTLRGIGLYKEYTAVLAAGGEPMEVTAARVDAELFRVLGVAPALGRLFTAQEVERRERLVLLGHDLWTSAFGGDPGILGRAVQLDGQPHTVVGIMPSGFQIAGRKDGFWTPAAPTDDDLAFRDEHAYSAVGRLAPGATLEAAQAEMNHIASDLATRFPDTNTDAGIRLVPLLDTVVKDSRRVLALLAAAALAVLLVACVNLSHVLLAQGVERRGEIAVRLALGARSSHLLRQSAAEGLALAAAGCAGGLLLAVLARRALPFLLATELPRLDNIAVDGGAVLFALGAGLAATFVSGLLPTVFVPRTAPGQAIAEHRHIHIRQDALVVGEIALTLMLVASALALVTSWLRLGAVDPGFDAHNVLVQEVRLPAWLYPDEARRGSFAQSLLADLSALPGVEGVALTSRLPIPGPAEVWSFRLAGEDAPNPNWTQGRSATMQFVTPGYFRLLRIPLLGGRIFDDRPGSEAGRVVMIDRSLAERHLPGANPVGTVVTMREQGYRIDGVFSDFRQQGLAEEPGDLMIQPWSQSPAAKLAALVRVAGRPLEVAPTVRRKLRELDPALPLPPAATLEDLVAQSVLGPRSRALLVGLLAGVALLLALIGTYGVMAHGVGRRRREIAIRMAAGAGRLRIQRWVLRRALGLGLIGVCLGLLGALATGRLLQGLLFGVGATDTLTLAIAALLLLAACLAAGYVPARRASRIDPALTLRGD